MEPVNTSFVRVGDVPATGPKQSADTGSAGAEVNKEMFLQLLVAQIRNQNPLNPSDGVEFLSQLAQFTSLEQMAGIRDEVAALRAVVEAADARQVAQETEGSASSQTLAAADRVLQE